MSNLNIPQILHIEVLNNNVSGTMNISNKNFIKSLSCIISSFACINNLDSELVIKQIQRNVNNLDSKKIKL